MDNVEIFATLADVPKEPGSQDPLGFGPSAERVADTFAPGLTVNTRSVRYYELLAAAVELASQTGAVDTRAIALRLERIWALASYLADPTAGERTGSGLAGIQRVRLAARPDNKRQAIDFRLFQANGQARMGVWGLYRKSADRLLLVDGFVSTALGARLAHPFLDDLGRHRLRKPLLAKDTKTIDSESLRDFGGDRGLFTPIDSETAGSAWDALRSDPNRRAAAKAVRAANSSQHEILQALARVPQFRRIAAAAKALEAAFAAVTRPFDAAVMLAAQAAAVDPRAIRTSPVLVHTHREWQRQVDDRSKELAEGPIDAAVIELGQSVARTSNPWEAVISLVDRHRRVQEAKGRQAWLEWRAGHLVRSAAAPDPGYDPFDPTGTPRGHDLRLRNLRDLAREVHAAGVTLA